MNRRSGCRRSWSSTCSRSSCRWHAARRSPYFWWNKMSATHWTWRSAVTWSSAVKSSKLEADVICWPIRKSNTPIWVCDSDGCHRLQLDGRFGAVSSKSNGKVVVITGGASGIGEACGHALVRDGWRVVVVDLQTDAAKKVAQELNGPPYTADT